MRELNALDREEIGAAIDAMIACLDDRDGDPDLEPTGDELDTGNGEDEALTGFMVLDGGPGCIVSDPPAIEKLGMLGYVLDDSDERPVCDPAALRHHRDRVRRLRCDRIPLDYTPALGRSPYRWELRA